MTTHPLSMLIDALRAAGDIRTAAGVEHSARHARVAIATDGLLLTDEEYDAIDEIAGRYFGFAPRKRAMMRKLKAEIPSLERRDPLETAIWSTIEASDRAHFYYGLVTGLLLVPAAILVTDAARSVETPADQRPLSPRVRRGARPRPSRLSTRAVVKSRSDGPRNRSKGARQTVQGHHSGRRRAK
jgi:hypothetical protein